MQKTIKHTTILESISHRKKVTGSALIQAFKKLPKISPINNNDIQDITPVLLSLSPEDYEKYTIPYPTKSMKNPIHIPLSKSPSCQVHVHAILCANDDGSGGTSDHNAVDALYIEKLIEATNIIYSNTGIQFVYDHTSNFEQLNSSLLNLDFTIPADLNLYGDEEHPPLTDKEIKKLSEIHSHERQRIGKMYHHKMVLLFCDGNMLIYDKQWKIIPRTFAFSGSNLDFVALPTHKGSIQGFANLLAHEIGHYFHLQHPHKIFDFNGKQRHPENLMEISKLIKNYVNLQNNNIAEGLNVFDGDGYNDTPPDASNEIFKSVYGSDGDCGLKNQIPIPIIFDNGSSHTYILSPDRGNVMSYFKHCINFKMHFSQEQIQHMKKSIYEKNRWHLCHDSVRLKILNPYVINNEVRYLAVWKPSTENEIQIYNGSYHDIRSRYDELWPQGWRLKILNPYVINNEVRYLAVWKPSTENEIQIYNGSYHDIRSRYDELWPQGWRLKILNPYVINNEVRYLAVWKPSTENEIQIYNGSYHDIRSKYDQMW